jgi:hypothetical protein
MEHKKAAAALHCDARLLHAAAEAAARTAPAMAPSQLSRCAVASVALGLRAPSMLQVGARLEGGQDWEVQVAGIC